MSHAKYAYRAQLIAEELTAELSEDRFAHILTTITISSYDQLLQFRNERTEELCAMAFLAPTARRKYLQDYSTDDQFWLLACAAHMARQSQELLSGIDVHLFPTGSYREMVQMTQYVLGRCQSSKIAHWPFPCEIEEDK